MNNKSLITMLAIAVLAFFLHGCAPGALAPDPMYETSAVSTGAYPSSTRAGHFDEDGFYITTNASGLGLEVEVDHWRGSLFGGYSGVNLRNSWSQDDFGVSLDTAYNAYYKMTYDDKDGDGYPDYDYVYAEMFGLALDDTYYFPIPTDIGSAYAGPRLRAYFACENIEQAGYECGRYGFLPGATLGINVPVAAISKRLVFGVEGSIFLVAPGITDESHFTLFSPFSFSLSYRF